MRFLGVGGCLCQVAGEAKEDFLGKERRDNEAIST